jgi:hypothetical protein
LIGCRAVQPALYRGTSSLVNIVGPKIEVPAWVNDAEAYYSRIEAGPGDSVRVMRFPEVGKASEENLGTLCLRLAASFRQVRVVGVNSTEYGVIRPRGPGFGYAMRRSGELIWTLSNRSLALRRHALSFASDGQWDVRTPFYWWLNVVCCGARGTHALGRVGHTKRLWLLWIQPGYDRVDVLAALAFLHRRWWRR